MHASLSYEPITFLALTRLPLPPSLSDSAARSGARLTLTAWMRLWAFIIYISSLLQAGHCLGMGFLFFNLAHVPFHPTSVGWLVFLSCHCTTPDVMSLIFLSCCCLWAYGLKPCMHVSLSYEPITFLALTHLSLPLSWSDSVARSGARLTLTAWMRLWAFIICISFLLQAGHCLVEYGLSLL